MNYAKPFMMHCVAHRSCAVVSLAIMPLEHMIHQDVGCREVTLGMNSLLGIFWTL